MNFFKRFIGDDLQLKGPNLRSAKEYTVDLSGTMLTFPAPPQTAIMSGHIQRFEFDITNAEELEPWTGSNNSGLKIHKNGWRLYGKKGRRFGYVKVDIIFEKIDLSGTNATFFYSNHLKKWLLSEIEADWGERNKKTIGILEKQSRGQSHEGNLWQYPTKTEQLLELSSKNAIYYHVFEPESGIETQYCIPIGSNHLLKFIFSLESVDCEFYSPEHNFPEASENLVKAFMDKVKVELSPEALAQQQAAARLAK